MKTRNTLARIILIATVLSSALSAAGLVTFQSLTFNPPSVDVLLNDQTATATLQITVAAGAAVGDMSTLYLDDNQGNDVNVPLGTGQPCAPAVAGCLIFTFPVLIPQGTPGGTYIPSVLVYDSSLPGYSQYFDNSTLLAAGLIAHLTMTDTGSVQPTCTLPPLQLPANGGGISDTTSPLLVGICLSPYTLDTRNSGSAAVTITLNITDDLSGFNYGWVNFTSPSGNQYFSTYVDSYSLIAGNANSGIYQFQQWFQSASESGAWSYNVQISDVVGNWNYPALPPDVSPLNVISAPDTTPPVWAGGTISGTFNVTSGPASVPVSIHIMDDLSGFTGNGYIQFQSPSGKQTFYSYFSNLQLTGTDNDGTWSGAFTIPRYSEPGTWKMAYVYLQDQAGNNVSMFQGGSVPAPGGGFTIIDSQPDLTPPQFLSLSFTPGAVNTSLSDQTINLSIAFNDSPAGLSSCQAGFGSPSGQQWHYTQTNNISGNSNSGVWSSSVLLPRYSELGNWQLGYLNCYDLANNYVSYGAADLKAKGFPTGLTVIQPSLLIDGIFSGANHTVKDSASNTTLSDPGNQMPSGTSAAIDVLAEPPANQPPQGFSIGTGFISVVLMPAIAQQLPPPGLTLTLTLLNQMLPGSELALYKIDPTSGKLVPEPKAGGGFVTGFVDSTGQSVTFTGISTLSTVVGLTPPARPGDLNDDGSVNCADIKIIRDSWAKRIGQLGFDSRADYNRDGVVNIFDLAALAKLLPRGTKCP